ncbi:MAG: glutamate formiminotransferase [Solirubrobacterales bacterium]
MPNVSEGADLEALGRVREGFSADPVALLDEHSDPVHNRTVFTLAGRDAALLRALRDLACRAIDAIDITRQRGAHPRISALDVCPVVWPDPALREHAREVALAVAEQLGAIGLPVFLYGELSSTPERAERAFFRRGGHEALASRMRDGDLRPDLGPGWPHSTAGAVMVTARGPLAAFNVELEGATPESGETVAARLRESGGGLPGVRAIAIELAPGRIQISTNVHDPVAVPLGRVVEEVRSLAAAVGATPSSAEIVGLVPAAALAGYPQDVPIDGGDPHRRTLEAHLGALDDG